MKDIEKKLKAPFNENELEWRVQSQGIYQNGTPWVVVIPYVQARAIQNRLDEIFGFDGWEDEYRTEKGTDTICRLSVRFNDKRISKENGASETHIEAFKGGISSAFKRVAASGYGIGRYLYELKPVMAQCTLDKKVGWNKSKYIDKTKKQETFIYWKTPKIQKCEVNTEPVAISEDDVTPEHPDFEIYLGLDCCNTVAELNAYFKEHKSKVASYKNFVAQCAERKQILEEDK